MAIILWSMSLWAAMIILGVSGFGQESYGNYGVQRRWVVLTALAVWTLGFLTVRVSSVRINLGFVLASGCAWLWLLGFGRGRLQGLGVLLGILAYITRMILPLSFDQAQVLPSAALESMGLGMAAGLSVGRAWPSLMVAASAQALSDGLIVWSKGQPRFFGQHDLAMVLSSAMAAWTIGWVVYQVSVRWRRLA